MIVGGVACITAMLMIELESGETWMVECAKWAAFVGKFAISGRALFISC